MQGPEEEGLVWAVLAPVALAVVVEAASSSGGGRFEVRGRLSAPILAGRGAAEVATAAVVGLNLPVLGELLHQHQHQQHQ